MRLFLAWSLIFGWKSCSIDFSNAFIQADIESPTFIHLPRGFRSKDGSKTCLKLHKSIYGLSVAPRLWYQHLWKALKRFGLKQSTYDPCLLFRSDLIVICYVDDLGIQSPKQEIIDTFINNLKDDGFDLTVEGSFNEYLGIKYTTLEDGSIDMTQEGLIKKIIDATGMSDCNSNHTPTTKEPLGTDEEGKHMSESWNYRSVVGMMLYLATNTRPDIAYAVSQVARFSHSPKQSHATAVKTIVRYLSGTKTKGTIFKKPSSLTLDCYVDADFAGLYGVEDSENPISVKSRTGYIISVSSCFITCKSQLQSTIALSTSEAEYGALSQSMRTLLPIRDTLLEFIQYVEAITCDGNELFPAEDLSSFQTTVYEDNATALSLATNQRITNRTKHWAVKSHFFWSHINDKDKNLAVVKIGTDQQRADYLTKGLVRAVFENCRKLNQGW